MRRHVTLLAVIWAVLAAGVASAQEVRFAWEGELRFDPAAAVPGGTLGTLLQEFAGEAALAGRMPVSGTVRYDRDAPVSTRNSQLAGFRDAVTEMTLDLGPVVVEADLARIAAHAETSRVGMVAFPSGGFCGDADHCENFGLPAPEGWGIAAGLLNDAWHTFVDETGHNQMFGDAFGFMVGRTDAPSEFLPSVQTQQHGLVSVDGVNLLLFSAEGADFFDGLALPDIRSLGTAGVIGRSEIAVFLELPGQSDRLRVEGTIAQIQPE